RPCERLEPCGDVRARGVRRPAGRRLIAEAAQTDAPDRAAERTPTLTHLPEQVGRPFGNGREELDVVLGVVAEGIPGDDGDDPRVVRVQLLRRKRLDLPDQ